MPTETIQLATLTRAVGAGVYVAEVPGLTEISALGDSERAALATLHKKLKALLEDVEATPAVAFHRRGARGPLERGVVEIVFEPPRRGADWREPVRVRVEYVQWEEDGLFQAYAPGAGVHVLAARADQLPGRVEEHARLVLGGRARRLSLGQLEELDRTTIGSVGTLECTVRRPSPVQIEKADDDAKEHGMSALAKVAEEWTAPAGAARGDKSRTEVEPAYGLESELRHLAEVLGEESHPSVLLVGPPSGGKTALAREFVRRRAEFGFGHTPFWATTAARLVSGAAGYGMWQERCRDACREASRSRAIVHVGHVADLLEVGQATRQGASVGAFLRPWIARGELRVLAECTPEQLGAIERRDPHLLGVLRTVEVPERTPEATREILGRVHEAAPGRPEGEVGGALDRLHRLHLRYATYSARPGRAVRFLRNLLADRFPEKGITEGAVIEAFARETGLPVVLLDDDAVLDPVEARAWFARRVMGQPEAVERVVDLLVTAKARLGRPRRPLGSFLFIGPTGTGKTEMAKALARYLFGDESRLARFDLNEFSDATSVARLIGGPGMEGGEGLLTARVREQPFAVLLLDEFEKAHPSFFDLLLQVLGDGRLTDGAGRVADFCNSVIVMTTNLGAQDLRRGPTGFRERGDPRREVADHFSEAVRRFLRPELFNRIEAIVPFDALTEETVRGVAGRLLDEVRQRDGLRLRPVTCELSEDLARHLADGGYDPRYGARPLKRALERQLLAPLAEALNAYAPELPLHASAGWVDGRVRISVRARAGEGGGAMEGTGGGGTAAGLAEAVVTLRRQARRFRESEGISRLEDEETMLGIQEKRAKAVPYVSPEWRARLNRLPRLRDCLGAIGRWREQVEALELDVLGRHFARERWDVAAADAAWTRLKAEQRRLAWVAYRFLFERPDELVLAVFGEPREAMVEYLAALRRHVEATPKGSGGGASAGGRVDVATWFVPSESRKSGGAAWRRVEGAKGGTGSGGEPAHAKGAVVRLTGNLVHARWAGEPGVHVVKRDGVESRVLVEAVTGRVEDYEPPEGLERPGGIRARAAWVRRAFDAPKGIVRDAELGERPWSGLGIEAAIGALVEDRLARDVARRMGGETAGGEARGMA